MEKLKPVPYTESYPYNLGPVVNDQIATINQLIDKVIWLEAEIVKVKTRKGRKMIAKDTVIKLEETTNDSLRIHMEKILLEQAEISFRAGIQEVIDWIKEHQSCDITMVTFNRKSVELCILIRNDEWQGQLKEWGIS